MLQIEGTAVPSVAEKLVQKLLDNTTPAGSVEYDAKERTAKDATGIAYAGDYDDVDAHYDTEYVVICCTSQLLSTL